jgi:hypothetical protein
VNLAVGLLHAPCVQSFRGFSRPWSHLEPLVHDVQVREVALGGGDIMTGRARPVPVVTGAAPARISRCEP